MREGRVRLGPSTILGSGLPSVRFRTLHSPPSNLVGNSKCIRFDLKYSTTTDLKYSTTTALLSYTLAQ